MEHMVVQNRDIIFKFVGCAFSCHLALYFRLRTRHCSWQFRSFASRVHFLIYFAALHLCE